MSTASSTAARLAFFGMPEEPEASATRSRVDAAASGARPTPTRGRKPYTKPEAEHVVHGRLIVNDHCELRVTTTAGRLWIRLWRRSPGGAWWPVKESKGAQVRATETTAFMEAIRSACKALGGDL